MTVDDWDPGDFDRVLTELERVGDAITWREAALSPLYELRTDLIREGMRIRGVQPPSRAMALMSRSLGVTHVEGAEICASAVEGDDGFPCSDCIGSGVPFRFRPHDHSGRPVRRPTLAGAPTSAEGRRTL